jgi:hypothetical protein
MPVRVGPSVMVWKKEKKGRKKKKNVVAFVGCCALQGEERMSLRGSRSSDGRAVVRAVVGCRARN